MASSRPDVRLIATPSRGRILVRAAPARPATGLRAGPAGVLLGFHGYLENAAIQLARMESIPGVETWTLVSVQALHRVYRGRSEETVASWMTRQDRDEMIADNIAYVNTVVEELGADARETRIACVGFSQGGAMAFRAGVRGAFDCAGIISAGADVPPDLTADPGARFPPMLVVRGARDAWLTAEKLDPGVAALRARGADVRALVIDAAHEWTAEASTAAGEFLQTLTKP
jgi:predicted esterase